MDNSLEQTYPSIDGKNNFAAHQQDYDDDEDDEEEECRVCRGPAEEGRPLFAPCKCSGSIGLVHQDCLRSWLEVTRGTKCELCAVPFKFVPKYADDAPDHLPMYEVVAGIMHRAAAKWLPFALRAIIAIILWICILPLATAYLYYGWMHRPSAVVSRWKWELIATDTVAGGIVAGAIIISFLALMSLADFLRFHWQQPNQNEANAHVVAEEPLNADDDDDDDDAFDADIFPYEAAIPDNTDGAAIPPPNANFHMNQANIIHANGGDNVIFPGNNNRIPHAHIAQRQQPQNIPAPRGQDAMPQAPRRVPPAQNLNENDRFEPRFEPMEAVQDQEDGMDIHVALDELLGLRGPLTGLIRNLMWLLAFNTIYLGVFACFPYSLGKKVYNNVSNLAFVVKVIGSLPNLSFDGVSFSFMLQSLNEESVKRNHVLQLPDLAAMVLGYLFLATLVFVWRTFFAVVVFLSKKARNKENMQRNGDPTLDRQQFMQNDNFQFDHLQDNMAEAEVGGGIATKIKTFLDGTASIVKVGLVLLVKMLFLPLFLGLWLDFATLSLFETNIHERISYAGADLFGSLLIHWVFGITFMLLVTVSVLQLREVAHPDLLAKIIRPQEPQPDLVGNILHENGLTHARRMILSLAVYVALLLVHVWFPAKILVSTGAANYLPFFRPKLWSLFLPELQHPIELLIFHLSMLALLEKFKNNIGQMQHYFLLTMCNMMDITDYVLPRSVSEFELVGLREVYIKKEVKEIQDVDSHIKRDSKQDEIVVSTQIQIDPFWKHLASEGKSCDDFILSVLGETFHEPILEKGITKNNGQRVLTTQSCIRISPEKPHEKNVSVPTAIGRYRLRSHYRQNNFYDDSAPEEYAPKIEIWKEVVGEPLFRPPDGWDDLGAGGAEVQGRWAWGKEAKSDIEEGVAKRVNFKDAQNKLLLLVKLILLVSFMWLGTLTLICCGTNMPLVIGRYLFEILHVPDQYIHDPAAFAVGVAILYPAMKSLWPILTEKGGLGGLRKVLRWVTSFRTPYSAEKTRDVWMTSILWVIVIPLTVGVFFNLFTVADQKWWSSISFSYSFQELSEIWHVGFILFHCWAAICYTGVFTKDFWMRFRGALEANENAQNAAGAANGAANNAANGAGNFDENNQNDGVGIAPNNHHLQWQGENGKIGQFLSVIIPVFSNWEWDKVDRDILLDEVLLPITKQLLMTLFSPVVILFISVQLQRLCLGLRSNGLDQSFAGNGSTNMILFRLLSIFMILIQIGSVFKVPLKKWLQVAHMTARDDRYLVGETLLNYQR